MTFRWDSQPRSEATGNFLGNDMIATAIAASPVSVTHGRYFLSLLQLQPPPAATLRTVIYQTVAPALAEMWADEQQEMFQKMRFDAEGDGRTVICEFDMSHSCVRSAEHSTASVTDAETGLILWFIVLSQGEAATREAIACMESLKFFVGEGVDTGAYVIDDNRQTRRMIEDFQRSCAGSDAERKAFVKVLLDVWHSKKSGKKELEKFVATNDNGDNRCRSRWPPAMLPAPQSRSTVAGAAEPCSLDAAPRRGSSGTAAPCSAHSTGIAAGSA